MTRTDNKEMLAEERFARAFILYPSPVAERVAQNVLKRQLAANRIVALTNRAIRVLSYPASGLLKEPDLYDHLG